MTRTYSFYIVIDQAVENSESIAQSVFSLSNSEVIVHSEHCNGISTFQISTSDLVAATKIKLLFSPFIQHEESGDS